MSSNLAQELAQSSIADKVLTSVTPEMEEDEPLLVENDARFVLFPIQHHDIWAMYKKHEVCTYISIFPYQYFFVLMELSSYSPLLDPQHCVMCKNQHSPHVFI